MKKVSSVVWQFFDRLEENKRCVAVLCKLCDSEYKYFGNTTNLRSHLIKKHPIQWEFRQNNADQDKPVDETVVIRAYGDHESSNHSQSSNRRKQSRADDNTIGFESVDIGDDIRHEDDTATLNLVRQMHQTQGSDEEWLEEDYVQLYEPKTKKTYRKIKRELVTPPRKGFTPSAKQHKERMIIDDTLKDEYTCFGDYVANKLRNFKSLRVRGNIQQIISTILWQAEYGMFDNPESVKRILMNTMHNSEINNQHTDVQDREVQVNDNDELHATEEDNMMT